MESSTFKNNNKKKKSAITTSTSEIPMTNLSSFTSPSSSTSPTSDDEDEDSPSSTSHSPSKQSSRLTKNSSPVAATSKSAPCSPPITTVTAASPEPPVLAQQQQQILREVRVISDRQSHPQTTSSTMESSRRTSAASTSPERNLSPNLSPSNAVSRSPIKTISLQQSSSMSPMQYIQAPPTRRRGSSNAPSVSGAVRRRSREIIPGPIRRASQVLISLTSPDGMSLYGECSRRDSRAVPQITLMSSTFQRIPMKDFGAEVRASMDVDQFLQQAVLLLDVNETSLEGIVDRIVKKVSKR